MRTAAMLTHARAPSSLGKHMGSTMSRAIVVMTMRLSAKMLPSPAMQSRCHQGKTQ